MSLFACLFYVVVLFAAVKGDEDRFFLPIYDHLEGGKHAAINISSLEEGLLQEGDYFFKKDDFVDGHYSYIDSPVVVVYTPPNFESLHAFYYPHGLNSVFDLHDLSLNAFMKYTEPLEYVASSIVTDHKYGFTPYAAQFAAPQFYSTPLTYVAVIGDSPPAGTYVPVIYISPVEKYLKQDFSKDFQEIGKIGFFALPGHEYVHSPIYKLLV